MRCFKPRCLKSSKFLLIFVKFIILVAIVTLSHSVIVSVSNLLNSKNLIFTWERQLRSEEKNQVKKQTLQSNEKNVAEIAEYHHAKNTDKGETQEHVERNVGIETIDEKEVPQDKDAMDEEEAKGPLKDKDKQRLEAVHPPPNKEIVYPVNNNTVDTSYLHGKYVFGTNHIILYNRVPKCGSRTLLSLVEEMAKKNNFVQRLGEINPRAHYKGKSTDEIPFESMTRRRIKNTKVGTFLHGHVFFLDLSTEQSLPPHKKPIYINLLRDPVSRFVSAYYFGRYGDGRFTNLKQLHKLTRPEYIDETINECFERKRWECVGDYTKTMILRYFCGYSEACKQPTREALEIAKRNVDKYVVIGLVEEYETFLKILEKLIPDFFRGILTEFMSSKESIREAKMHAKHKVPPTPEVATKMRDMFQLDYEFYNYTRTKFYELREKLGII